MVQQLMTRPRDTLHQRDDRHFCQPESTLSAIIQKALSAMPYDFTSPTATEHQLEEPAAADGNLRAKVGHPVTVYSQETAERVCELIATGHNHGARPASTAHDS